MTMRFPAYSDYLTGLSTCHTVRTHLRTSISQKAAELIIIPIVFGARRWFKHGTGTNWGLEIQADGYGGVVAIFRCVKETEYSKNTRLPNTFDQLGVQERRSVCLHARCECHC